MHIPDPFLRHLLFPSLGQVIHAVLQRKGMRLVLEAKVSQEPMAVLLVDSKVVPTTHG